MKKSVVSLTALLLAIVMMFSLASCDNATDPDVNDGPTGSGSNDVGSNDVGSSAEDPYFGAALADGIAVSTRESKYGTIYEYAANITGTFEKKTPKDTIVIGGGRQAASADPHVTVAEFPWSHNIYESLLRKNDVTGEIEPCLATDYYYDDGGNLHFILREGVKFHDGNIMTAEDVMFSIQRAANSPTCRARDTLAYIDFENSYIENDYHVVFAFSEPCGAILSWLTSSTTAIMSKAFVEEVGDDYDYLTGDAGTGAYYLVSTVTEVSQEFERFDDYWGGTPEVKHISFRRYTDYTAMMIDYENGDLDYCYANTLESVMRVVNGEVPDTTMIRIPNVNIAQLYLCQIGDVTPFTDVRVRQALAYCIDYEGIMEAIYKGSIGADFVYSCLAPGMDGYSEVGLYEYNPEKAADLLAECGYSTDNPCYFEAAVSSGAGADKEMEIIQACANAVGFNMKLNVFKAAQMNEINNSSVVPSEYQLGYGAGGSGCGDLFELWVGKLAGNGHAIDSAFRGIPDDAWCLAIDNATSATDTDARNEYLLEMQQIAYDEVLTIPLYTYVNFAMYRPYLSGITNISGYGVRWADFKVAD